MYTREFLEYLTNEKKYSAHTLISYHTDLNQIEAFLIRKHHGCRLHEANQEHIRSWIASLSGNNMSAVAINRKISTLKAYFRFVCQKGLATTNPTDSIHSLKKPVRLPVFFPEHQIKHLLDRSDDLYFTPDYEGNRDKLIIELLYATGIRVAELIQLRDTDIDPHSATVKVNGKRSKQRIVPIHREMCQKLRAYQKLRNANLGQQSFPALFVTQKGAPLYSRLVTRLLNKYMSLITTLEKKSPHVLRHSFATHMLNHGADINALKNLLGHASLAATQVYTHNSIETLKDAYRRAHPHQ